MTVNTATIHADIAALLPRLRRFARAIRRAIAAPRERVAGQHRYGAAGGMGVELVREQLHSGCLAENWR